jgi:hypothetical protein
MGEIITKEEFDEIMKVKGEVRGVTLQGYRDYILKEEGKEGLEKIKKVVVGFGYPKKIRTMDFYPIGYQVLAIEMMKRTFNYDEKKFQEIGEFSAKVSMIVRLFSRYFFSVKQVMEHIPKMWEKYYTVGKIELGGFKEEEGFLIIRLKDFYIHPFHGQVLVGYFSSLIKMISGQKAKGEEIKSPFRGDDCYEFLMKW